MHHGAEIYENARTVIGREETDRILCQIWQRKRRYIFN